MSISIKTSGSFTGTMSYLGKLLNGDQYRDLDRFGQMGVNALASATPIYSGATRDSWGYNIKKTKNSVTIVWTNSNTNKGAKIAILLQYGHGTGTGGYVAGRNYINPAIQPIFDQIANDVWEKVIRG